MVDLRMRRFESGSFCGPIKMLLLVLLLLGAAFVDGREKSDDLIRRSLSTMLQRYDVGMFQYPSAGQQGIHKTCYNYFVCEAYPSVQLNRFAFAKGEAVADLSSLQSLEVARHLDTLPSAKQGHLPSCLVSLGGGNYDYVAGPKLSKQSPASVCTAYQNETAVFVFPWETSNAFHSLNDNTFAVLSQVLLHRLLHAPTTAAAEPYRVYSWGRSTPMKSTTMFQLLFYLFSDHNRLSSTTKLLTGGASCLQAAAWGSPVKVFYFDSLFNFRAEQDTAVVGRKLSLDSEQRLADVYRAQGAEVSICCNFTQLNTVEKVVEAFWDVDICVGVHGAGMINCVFGRPGLVVVELQNHHAFGLETFMRMAHMARGHYVFYDVRSARKIANDVSGGAHLTPSLVKRIVDTTLALLRFSQRHLPVVEARMHPQNMTAPNGTLLHRHRRDYRIDSGRLFTYKPPLTGAQIAQRWYSHELVLDFQARRAYHDRQPLVEEFLRDDLQRQLRRGGRDGAQTAPAANAFEAAASTSYRPIDHALEALRNLDKEQSVQERFPMDNKTKRRRKHARFTHIDGGFTYVAPQDHEELWVFFHPALFGDFPRATALGPLFEDAYEYCIRLPFFKFRLMTQTWAEHRAECDRHFAHRTRSGENDGALLGPLRP